MKRGGNSGRQRATRRRVGSIVERLAVAYPDRGCTLEHETPFQLLVATVLAAQSRDDTVNAITPALFRRYPTPQSFVDAEPDALEQAIRRTGYYRQKARAVRGLSEALLERFGGEVPADLEALTSLPGVGRKTASIVCGAAFGIPAIGVDTHVDRVSKRLGLTASTERNRERIEEDLKCAFPKARWIEANWLLILHGRRTCTARRPACPRCPVDDLCPYPDKTPA